MQQFKWFKILMVIAFLGLHLHSEAQMPKDTLTNQFAYRGKIKAQVKDSLMQNAKAWIKQKYNTSFIEEITDSKDKIEQTGSFIVNVSANGFTHSMRVTYLITLSYEDTQYHYLISDFKVAPNEKGVTRSNTFEAYDANPLTEKGETQKMKLELFKKTNLEIQKLMQELKKALST